MNFPTKKEIANLKKRLPEGTRVELLAMDDVQAPPLGTRGTVLGIDDAGSVVVSWDNGSGLNLIYGVDEYRVVK